MSTTALRSGMQDNAARVATRSRRRLRDEADASPPAGDPYDRKGSQPQSQSVPLRRSSRHAAKVASKAEIQNSLTRHPEPAIETPSTSRSTTLLVENWEPTPPPSLPPHENGHPIDQSDRIPPGTRGSASRIAIPYGVEIIDLTGSRTPQKRKYSTDDTADSDTGIDERRRVTRSTSKKARLDGLSNPEILTRGSSLPGTRASRPIVARRRTSKPIAETQLGTHEPPKLQAPTSDLSDVDHNETQPSVVGPSQCPQSVHESPVHFGTSPLSGFDTQALQKLPGSECPGSEDIQPKTALLEEPYPSSALTRMQVDEPDNSTGNSAEQVALVNWEESAKKDAGGKPDEIDTEDSTPSSPLLPTSSNVDSMTDRPRSPKSTSCRYFGMDGWLLRSRKPPSSYLAPNPVRRAPKSQTARRDEFRYLLHATEKAGLIAFAQTRRQFPRWMKRPSRIYFKGSEFYPRGRPATEQDMDAVEVGVGIDFDGMLASSTPRDIFILPQEHIYSSNSVYAPPHMELDPDLDPSSLLNSQSSFYAHDAATEFGPGPSAQLASSLAGPYQQPQEHFWPISGMPLGAQGPFASGTVSLAGPSTGSSPCGRILSGNDQGCSQEMSWDPSNWVDSPQFSLFGVPPLPVPAQNMSLDSSLSAMATYLVNDAPLKANLDSTMLNLIDGIPAAMTTSQSYLGIHPPIDNNSPTDGYQITPLN